MSLTRRSVLKGAAALLTAACLPKTGQAELPSFPETAASSIMTEIADVYRANCLSRQADQTQTTILYPGSGWDLEPLDIGLHLLHTSMVQRVRYIHTEIGPVNDLKGAFANAFPESLEDLRQKTEAGLERRLQQGTFLTWRREIRQSGPWIRKDVASTVISYDLPVARHPGKNIMIDVCYNTFEQRTEPTEEERKVLSPELIRNARQGYWPEGATGLQPTYFNKGQFDQSDVLISKRCGYFGLLQLDYVRALQRTASHKQRAIITEHADNLEPVVRSLPGYLPMILQFDRNDYGYCERQKDCRVGMLLLQKG